MNSKVLWRKLILVIKMHFKKNLAFHFIKLKNYTQTCEVSLLTLSANPKVSLYLRPACLFQVLNISSLQANDSGGTELGG